MNGRKRPLFDEELSERMRVQPATADERRGRGACARRAPGAKHSTPRNSGSGISVISALLTGRRSRSIACLTVAAFVTLSAIVSVTASIVASHISYAQEDGDVTAYTEKNVLSASNDEALRKTDVAENAAEAENGTDIKSDRADGGKSEVSADGDAQNDDAVLSDDSEGDSGVTQGAQGTDGESSDGEKSADIQAPADAAGQKYTVKISFWDGDSVSLETTGATLGEVISASGTALSSAQLANLDLSMVIDSDVTVNADVVTYETEDVEETIPYETEYVQSASLSAGVTEVTQKGVEGNQTRRFTVTYVNGAEVARVQTASWVDSYVQNQVITTGTGQSAPVQTQPPQSTAPEGTDTGAGTVTGANGVTYSYSSFLDVRATCYYAGGTTAYGIPADENVIGVDPSVIPFGTRVYVVGPYGDFGVRIAADCGNMYGNRIDVCLNRDNPLAPGFGWQNMRVYILN